MILTVAVLTLSIAVVCAAALMQGCQNKGKTNTPNDKTAKKSGR